MRIQTLLSALILVGCSHSAPRPTADASVSQYQLRPYEIQMLGNGLKIVWIPDEKLPVVSVGLAIRAGAELDPSNLSGLADFTALMLNKGIPGKDSVAISDQLEQRADQFAATVESDALFVGIRGLSFHDRDSLNDLFAFVTKPTFPSKEIERQKKLTVARLSRLTDRPPELANIAFDQLIMGSHPYAHPGFGKPASVAKIRRQDVIEFHHKYYAPERATLAVVGQFDADFRQDLVKLFSGWKRGSTPVAPVPVPTAQPGFQIEEVTKPGLNQAEVRIGELGVKRDVPDHMPLKVANSILGGGSFASRLFAEIRIKRGLTYGVHSGFDQRIEAGPFEISTFTRNDKIFETVQETLNVVKLFRDQGVTDAEVESAKLALIGRFPRILETGEDLAHQILALDVYGISYDYLKNFQAEVSKVTTAEVNAAIRAHVQPENMKVLVFGAAGAKDLSELKKLGPVTTEDYSQVLQ